MVIYNAKRFRVIMIRGLELLEEQMGETKNNKTSDRIRGKIWEDGKSVCVSRSSKVLVCIRSTVLPTAELPVVYIIPYKELERCQQILYSIYLKCIL